MGRAFRPAEPDGRDACGCTVRSRPGRTDDSVPVTAFPRGGRGRLACPPRTGCPQPSRPCPVTSSILMTRPISPAPPPVLVRRDRGPRVSSMAATVASAVGAGPARGRGGLMDYKLGDRPTRRRCRRRQGLLRRPGRLRGRLRHRPQRALPHRPADPAGSSTSIAIGTNLTRVPAVPGSAQGLHLVVEDIDRARQELTGRGVEVTDIDDRPWGRFAWLSDPDGNGWELSQPSS